MFAFAFRVHYKPKDRPINLKNIHWEQINATSAKDAIKQFNIKYPNNQVLYVTKI
jgi:hypothetical protein